MTGSPTKHAELFARLAAPFRPDQVRTRPGGRGKELSYITARTAMNRLDDVLGPENWSSEFKETKDGLMCSITATLPDGTTVKKTDGGGFADMPEEDNTEKSGYSDAFKRACVHFGVARYLYQDGTPDFIVEIHRQWGMTGGDAPAPRPAPSREQAAPARQPQAGGNGGNFRPPTNGSALFAWAKEQSTKFEVDLIKWLDSWGKLKNLPRTFKEWTPEEITEGYNAAVAKLNRHVTEPAGRGDAYEEALSN